jgi:hypothetical protein
MQSNATSKLVVGPWKAQTTKVNDEPQKRSKDLCNQGKSISTELAQRLFEESELRFDRPEVKKVVPHVRNVASTDIFINRTVLMFAAPSSKNGEILSWLEKIFDLYVLNAQNPTFFYEWLFRYADVADLMIIDRDTFKGDRASFNRFVRIAREACELLPLVVVSEEFAVDDFSFRWCDDWDVSLRNPVSQTSLSQAVEVACEISLHGR